MSRLLFPLLLTLALASACSDGGSHRERAPVDLPAPEAFPAESTGVPAGFREVLCPDLREKGIDLTVRLVVPVRAEAMNLDEHGCSFTSGFVRGVSVRLAPEESLADFREEELDPFEGDEGDDHVSGIEYRTGVPGLAGQPAEEVTWTAFNDGLPFWQIDLQAAGVRLSWSVPEDKPHRLDVLDVVRRSVAVLPGRRASCPAVDPSGKPTLHFTPPPGVNWIETAARPCRIYLDDSTTLLEYAAVQPAPAPLEQLAALVRKDPEVVRVRLERDAGRIAGEPADRLTWVVERTEETESYEPAGTWRIEALQSASARVEWGATPQWWREHRATYDDLVGSVAVVR